MSFTVIGWWSYAFTSWNWRYRESEEGSSMLASMRWPRAVLMSLGGNRSEMGPNCDTFIRQSAQIFIGAGKSKTWPYRAPRGEKPWQIYIRRRRATAERQIILRLRWQRGFISKKGLRPAVKRLRKYRRRAGGESVRTPESVSHSPIIPPFSI